MGIGEWTSQNLFNLFSAIGIIGSWWFASITLRKQTKAMEDEAEARRSANLLTITANHRELWKVPLLYPALARVIDPVADVAKQPHTSGRIFHEHGHFARQQHLRNAQA